MPASPRSCACLTHSASSALAVMRLMNVQFVEIEKAKTSIQFRDPCDDGQPDGLIFGKGKKDPTAIGVREIEVFQALAKRFRGRDSDAIVLGMLFSPIGLDQEAEATQVSLVSRHDSQIHNRCDVPGFGRRVHAQDEGNGYTSGTAQGSTTGGLHEFPKISLPRKGPSD